MLMIQYQMSIVIKFHYFENPLDKLNDYHHV